MFVMTNINWHMGERGKDHSQIDRVFWMADSSAAGEMVGSPLFPLGAIFSKSMVAGMISVQSVKEFLEYPSKLIFSWASEYSWALKKWGASGE